MSNERLRAALQQAGMQADNLAEQLDVDAKTVRRWLSGRVPVARHRARTIEILAKSVEVTEHDLWPETTGPPAGDDSRDLIAIYARGDDVRIPDWRALLHDAHDQIDLLDTTLTPILATTNTTDLLLEKARAGARVRILIAHPQSIWTTSLAQQLGDAQRDDNGQTQLERDLDLSHGYLHRLLGQPRIELHSHWAERTQTILRFDDEMLVTIHQWGAAPPDAPVMHLRHRDQGGLLDRFAAQIDHVIQNASEPIEPRLPAR